MIAIRQSPLGRGVYGMPEAARYTGLHPSRVRSWFTTRPSGLRRGPLFLSDYPIIENKYGISFYDLIDVLVAGQLRDNGVTMAAVRAVYIKLQERLNTQHPFCHHRFYTDGRTIIIAESDDLEDDSLSEALSSQMLYSSYRTVLRKMDYSDETQHANRWNIARRVIIDPDQSFGKPVIAGTSTTTFVLANQYYANNDDAELVADMYRVTLEDVLCAVDFEERHGPRR